MVRAMCMLVPLVMAMERLGCGALSCYGASSTP